MKTKVSIAVLAAILCAATLQAQNATVAGDRMTVNFSDPSRPGLVRVNLINGAISVTTHSGRDVIIEGRAVGRRAPAVTQDGLRRIDAGGGGLTVEEANNVIAVSGQSFFGSSNLQIQVPARTNLNLSTVNGGSVVVQDVEGDIEVTNRNGNVRLTNIAGAVIAHATNGALTASLRQVAPDKPMSFTSMNARVDVTLPADTKANLRIRTDNGAAYSDFDIQLRPGTLSTAQDTRSRGGRLRIETDAITGTINGGGPDIEVRTLNGNIYIRKGK